MTFAIYPLFTMFGTLVTAYMSSFPLLYPKVYRFGPFHLSTHTKLPSKSLCFLSENSAR